MIVIASPMPDKRIRMRLRIKLDVPSAVREVLSDIFDDRDLNQKCG